MFKNLGSIIQNDGEINEDVTYKIQAGWLKWRKALGVICDCKVATKLNGQFYHTAIHLAIILYMVVNFGLKRNSEKNMSSILRWMYGHKRRDIIQKCTWEDIGVALIEKKMTKYWLRFGHVQIRPLETSVNWVNYMIFSPIKRGEWGQEGNFKFLRGIPWYIISKKFIFLTELNDIVWFM